MGRVATVSAVNGRTACLWPQEIRGSNWISRTTGSDHVTDIPVCVFAVYSRVLKPRIKHSAVGLDWIFFSEFLIPFVATGWRYA